MRIEKQNITETKINPANTFVGVDALVSLPTIQINEITHGDSLELTGCVPAKADLILEDMPYNTTQNRYDKEPIDLKKYWESRMKLIKPTGVICLTASQPFTSKLVASNYKMFKYDFIWDKKHPKGFLNANKMPLRRHEDILIFSLANNGVFTYNKQMVKGKFRNKKAGGTNNGCYGDFTPKDNFNDEYYPTSVIELSSANQNGKIHPNQKPVGLFEYLIRTYTNEGDLVFDGFGGSGTTAIAAYRTKRNFIVIENDKEYFESASKRLYQERNPLSTFDEAS